MAAMYTYFGLIFIGIITMINGAPLSEKVSMSMLQIPSLSAKSDVTIDVCQDCIKEAVDAINVLLNLILDEGIIGSCGDLCNALVNKTGSKYEGIVCLLVCNAIGIDELIKLLEQSDLDPIWYCQIAKLCPSKRKLLLLSISLENGMFS